MLAKRNGYKLCGWPMAFLKKLATYELASRILYELCGWPMAFLRQIELAMSYVAEEIGYMCWRVEFCMSYMAGPWGS